MSGTQGPTILWESLKGKKVKTSDGQDLGEIKEISQNYFRVDKGVINKDKVWIPKYIADAYDGKVLWLLATSDDLMKSYVYGEEQPAQQYVRDYEAFRTTPYGEKAMSLPDLGQNIRITEQRTTGATTTTPTTAAESDTAAARDYKNIREPEG